MRRRLRVGLSLGPRLWLRAKAEAGAEAEIKVGSEAHADAVADAEVEAEAEVIGDRSVESIRKTLSQNKGAVYSLYRRALRSEPELQGKLTIRLVIAPNGQLTSVTLVGTDLDSDDLVQRLLSRIRLINFGALNVTTTELEYTYNFLPF